jgi:hypothetical protein
MEAAEGPVGPRIAHSTEVFRQAARGMLLISANVRALGERPAALRRRFTLSPIARDLRLVRAIVALR